MATKPRSSAAQGDVRRGPLALDEAVSSNLCLRFSRTRYGDRRTSQFFLGGYSIYPPELTVFTASGDPRIGPLTVVDEINPLKLCLRLSRTNGTGLMVDETGPQTNVRVSL